LPGMEKDLKFYGIDDDDDEWNVLAVASHVIYHGM
jgi:hypothetical protein